MSTLCLGKGKGNIESTGVVVQPTPNIAVVSHLRDNPVATIPCREMLMRAFVKMLGHSLSPTRRIMPSMEEDK